MDLPKAIAAQTETFQAMTSMLKELRQPTRESKSLDEGIVDNESQISAMDDILAAAKNYAEDSAALDQSQAEGEDEVPDEVREILGQTTPQHEYGEKLLEVVATSFSKITNPMSLTLADELKTRYKVPENCRQLAVPKVNTEIWAGLPQAIKTRDAKSQHLQQHLSRALIAQAKASERILELISKTKNAELQGVLKTQMDSAMAVGLAMKEINGQRKQNLKPSLLQEYAGLASAQLPVTEYLFGDNLEASLKLVKSTSKIVKSGTGFRYHPYGNRPQKSYGTNNAGNLNFRRQSFRGPHQATGSPRQQAQWQPRQTFQVQNKGMRFRHQQQRQ